MIGLQSLLVTVLCKNQRLFWNAITEKNAIENTHSLPFSSPHYKTERNIEQHFSSDEEGSLSLLEFDPSS